ncbi:winged helix-turn-helix domain-containing protein [uncultured Acetatifactor sp.]|uniref:winged helix-turn-helix domain-containing protein n=2 Tax=uncultured Acetatifactor sp. TaxID=1671927 RepID=UPI00262708C0|nr:winged helix-turn-helix domain-containing protein [uncultured Acetatifactor sp.]
MTGSLQFREINLTVTFNNILLKISIPIPASGMSFPGLEIMQNRRRILQDGEEISLTRLEYSTLVFLASNPGIVLTQSQIFEAVCTAGYTRHDITSC